MRTESKSKILELIQNKPGIRSSSIVKAMKLHATAIFRHLKDLENKRKIFKVGSPPRVSYYCYMDAMNSFSGALSNAINWAISGNEKFGSPDFFCVTRDVFQARIDHLLINLKKSVHEDLAYLLVAVAGEIGNNSFDHNIGNWIDAVGVYCNFDLTTHELILADRGQGIFKTLKRVRPQLSDDVDALHTAFTEIVSGRAPEARGNGLKFVKKIIIESQLYLQFYSGSAVAEITQHGMEIRRQEITIPGVLAYIKF